MTKDMLHIVIPLVGSGLAGSMFSYFAVKRRDRYIADLRITIFPSLESERVENDHVQCFAKFTMKSGPKPISEMELIPKLGSSKQLQRSKVAIPNPVTRSKKKATFPVGGQMIKQVIFLLLACLLVVAGCGGGGGGAPAPGTSSLPPIATTQAATSVTTSGAVLNGSVNPNGMATDVWFEYSLNSNLSGSTQSTRQAIGSGVAAVSVNYPASGFAAGTTYYYRVCASSTAGTTPGTIMSCTTGFPGVAPTVQTLAASGIGTNNAGISGSVNPNSQATNAWFEWGTSSSMASYFSTSSQSAGSGSSAVILNATLSSLSSGAPYYYRVAATNGTGTSRGAIVSFTTSLPSIPPTATTLGATSIGVDNATVNGTVNPNGLATTANFEWGLDNTFASPNTTTGQSIGSGSSAVAVNATLSGLTDNTTYYYRVVGTNSAGTSRGVIGSFTTQIASGLAPVITGITVGTPSGDNVSVTLTVDPVDPFAVIEAWLETSPDNNVWTPTAHQTVNPGSPVTLTFSLTSLPVGETFIRGRASNSWGADAWQKGDKVTVAQGNGTITINSIRNGNSAIIFCNNVEVHNYYNNTGADANTSYVGPTGSANKYKFVYILGTYIAATRPLSMVDANLNNVFQMVAREQLTVNPAGIPAVNGRIIYNFSGSGFTPSYQAPVNVSGVWHIRSVVDNSTNGNVPVGAEGTWDITCSQNEFQILWADPDLGTINGTINGDLIYNWGWGFSDPLWLITWRETLMVNAAGTTLTGDNMETWQARSGTDYFYAHGNSTGTR